MRYEYRPVVGVHGPRVTEGGLTAYENLFDLLDEAGRQGWEAVAVLSTEPATEGTAPIHTVLMKRQLE